MFNIKIITVGKIKDNNFLSLSEKYLKRIKPFASIKIEEVKADSFSKSNKEKIRQIEDKRIEKVLEKYNKENIFLLDENGKEFNSIGFAEFLDKQEEMIFVIAGSLGFSNELKKKYQKISLSQLTFPHEMARVVLLEQIYRATAIVNKKEYHY